MTEVIKEPKKRSRVNLIILITSLVLLIVGGGYWVYKQKLTEKSESISINQIEPNLQDDHQTSQKTNIPEGWSEYELGECGVKIYLPQEWSFEEFSSSEGKIHSMASNSSERLKELKTTGEGYSSLQIICYSSIKDLIDSTSNAKSISNAPTTLEETLNIKNPNSDVFYNIFDFGSKPEKIILSNKIGFQGLQGGFGVTLNRYFEHNGGIIEIRTDNFNQNTLTLDPIDQQIQDLIEFMD